MQKFFFLFTALSLFSLHAYPHTFSGSVKDDRGNPVEQATVYIEELQQGTATDADGFFRLRLDEGEYTCVFRCMGYTSITQRISVSKQGLELKIVMPIQSYGIGAVIINKNREDPAYAIMRQVIGMAPYYSSQVDYYKANVYIKGSMKIEKISRILKALGGKEFREGLKLVGKHAIILESMNEITFNAPKSFHHKVISTNSSLPIKANSLNTMDFVQTNMYQTNIVARDAFKNYKFSYEGYSEDNGLTINKIKVTPIIKNPMLVSGYIYILDGTWHIYSVNLAGKAPFGSYKMVGNCYQIRPDVYLPAAFKIDGDIDMLGNKLTASYQLSLKYTDVRLNTKLANPLRRTATPAPPIKPQPSLPKMGQALSKTEKKAAADSVKRAKKQAERRKKIDDLFQKEELNNRDMNRLARLMEEEAEATKVQSLDLSSNYKVDVDTNSRKLNAAQWDTLRPVELNEAELGSYKYADTLKQIFDADTAKSDTIRKGKISKIIGKFFGGTVYFNDQKSWLRFNLLDINSMKFNAVDGYRYGIDLQLRHGGDNERQFRLMSKAAWAFARKAVRWDIETQWKYSPERRANFIFHAGMINSDYNYHRDADNMIYTYAALFAHNNYTRLYEQVFVLLRNEIDIDNGLALIAHAQLTDKWRLANHTNHAYLFPHAKYEPNLPYNTLAGDNPPLYRTAMAELLLIYTPEYYYRMSGKRKIMVRSKYPTFTLRYQKAIPSIAAAESDYDLLSLRLSQNMRMGLMRRFSYSAEVAAFLNNKRIDLTNYYHFNVMGFALDYQSGSGYADRYYKFATNGWGAAANANYVTPLLLLKYIPWFSETYCRENLKYMGHYSSHGGYYNAFYYGISEILLFIEAGLFVEFEDARYAAWGINIRLNL